MAKKNKGVIKVLMSISYKDCPIYIRLVGKEVFMWDVVIKNQLYGSYVLIKSKKNGEQLNPKEIDEVIKMCYAGAAATIDNVLGIELTEDEKELVKKFNKAVINIKGEKPNA